MEVIDVNIKLIQVEYETWRNQKPEQFIKVNRLDTLSTEQLQTMTEAHYPSGSKWIPQPDRTGKLNEYGDPRYFWRDDSCTEMYLVPNDDSTEFKLYHRVFYNSDSPTKIFEPHCYAQGTCSKGRKSKYDFSVPINLVITKIFKYTDDEYYGIELDKLDSKILDRFDYKNLKVGDQVKLSKVFNPERIETINCTVEKFIKGRAWENRPPYWWNSNSPYEYYIKVKVDSNDVNSPVMDWTYKPKSNTPEIRYILGSSNMNIKLKDNIPVIYI